MAEKTSVTKICIKIGLENYETVCRLADSAVIDSGYREDQRLLFAYEVEGTYGLTTQELVAIYEFRLWSLKLGN